MSDSIKIDMREIGQMVWFFQKLTDGAVFVGMHPQLSKAINGFKRKVKENHQAMLREKANTIIENSSSYRDAWNELMRYMEVKPA